MAGFTDFIPMQKELHQTKADLAAAHAEIERLTHLLDLSKKTTEAVLERAEKAEAERDEALAQVAAVIEKAANIALYGDDDDPDWLMNRAESIRALTPAHAKAALESYGREKVREGMRQAVDLYPQGIAAILAAMEKEGGE